MNRVGCQCRMIVEKSRKESAAAPIRTNTTAGRYDHEGHYRMRHDAKLATIGVTTIGVHVRHLGHGEQRQQDQAHHSRRAQTSWL